MNHYMYARFKKLASSFRIVRILDSFAGFSCSACVDLIMMAIKYGIYFAFVVVLGVVLVLLNAAVVTLVYNKEILHKGGLENLIVHGDDVYEIATEELRLPRSNSENRKNRFSIDLEIPAARRISKNGNTNSVLAENVDNLNSAVEKTIAENLPSSDDGFADQDSKNADFKDSVDGLNGAGNGIAYESSAHQALRDVGEDYGKTSDTFDDRLHQVSVEEDGSKLPIIPDKMKLYLLREEQTLRIQRYILTALMTVMLIFSLIGLSGMILGVYRLKKCAYQRWEKGSKCCDNDDDNY